MRAPRLALTVLLAGAVSCQLVTGTPPTVSLRVQGNVADAQVTIDDIPVGALAFVAARGVALPPGRHRITVERTSERGACLSADHDDSHSGLMPCPASI